MPTIPQDKHDRKPFDLVDARRYLEAIELIAREARTSYDSREVAGALRVFAQPSRLLRRLAGLPDVHV